MTGGAWTWGGEWAYLSSSTAEVETRQGMNGVKKGSIPEGFGKSPHIENG